MSSFTSPRNEPSIFEAKRLIWPIVWKADHRVHAASPLRRPTSTFPNRSGYADGPSPIPDLTLSPTSSESSLPSTFSHSSRLTFESEDFGQIFAQVIPNLVAPEDPRSDPKAPASSCAKDECATVEIGGFGPSGLAIPGFGYACAGSYAYGFHPDGYDALGAAVPCDACASAGLFNYNHGSTPLPIYHNETRYAYPNARSDTTPHINYDAEPSLPRYSPQPVSNLNPTAPTFIPRISVHSSSLAPQNVDADPQALAHTTPRVMTRIVDYDQRDDYFHYTAVDANVASLHQPSTNVDVAAKPMSKLDANAAAFVPSIVVSPQSPTRQEVEGSLLDVGGIEKQCSVGNGLSAPLNPSPNSSGKRKNMQVGVKKKKAELRRNKVKIAMGSGWRKM